MLDDPLRARVGAVTALMSSARTRTKKAVAEDEMMVPEGTKTHPFVATILMDPAKLHSFKRAFEDRREVRILMVDDKTPGCWTLYAACASEEVHGLLESNW